MIQAGETRRITTTKQKKKKQKSNMDNRQRVRVVQFTASTALHIIDLCKRFYRDGLGENIIHNTGVDVEGIEPIIARISDDEVEVQGFLIEVLTFCRYLAGILHFNLENFEIYDIENNEN